MPELEASRTLVKSTPELWAECSDAASLARHLGSFGEIRITRLEPETAVAWEGDEVRGTVTLEPSGWGTRVVLTAVREAEAEAEAEALALADSDAEPVATETPSEESPWAEPHPDEDSRELALTPITPSVVSAESPPPAAMEPLPEPTLLMRVLSRLGVRVRWPTSTAVTAPLEVDPDPELDPDPEPFPEPAPDPVAVEEPVAEESQPMADEEPEASEPELDALISALDSLGTPRRRPFSRA